MIANIFVLVWGVCVSEKLIFLGSTFRMVYGYNLGNAKPQTI